MSDQSPDLTELTAQLVATFVARNTVSLSDMPALIGTVYSALSSIGGIPVVVAEHKAPAVSVRKSITPDYLICLEDGKRFKSLKRHLRTKYDLTPEKYRAKWDLPATYPMVAPAYSATRSALAKEMGLGSAGGKVKATPAKRGRAKGGS